MEFSAYFHISYKATCARKSVPKAREKRNSDSVCSLHVDTQRMPASASFALHLILPSVSESNLHAPFTVNSDLELTHLLE